MTTVNKIKKLLELRPEIKPLEAAETLKIKYSNSFRQTFYYVKKCNRNEKITLSNNKNDTKTRGRKPSNSTPKLTIDYIEPLVVQAIEENPNYNTLKLAIEIIKLKQTDSGMEDDIDMDKYIRKVYNEHHTKNIADIDLTDIVAERLKNE